MDPPPTAASTSLPSTNPPSIEAAYKRKCIALKKRLSEVEAENEIVRLRNRRGWQYIQKMRLESCILLERLAKVTGMTEEAVAQAQVQGQAVHGHGELGQGLYANPELRARAAAIMSNAALLNNTTAAVTGNVNGARYLDDETEGSSDEQPPTPQERPLRVKRSKKSNVHPDDDDITHHDHHDDHDHNDNSHSHSHNNNNNNDHLAEPTTSSGSRRASSSSALPRLAPAPSQEELTSSFRIQTSNGHNSYNGGSVSEQDRRHSHHSHSSHRTEPESGFGPGPGHMSESSFAGMGAMDVDYKVKEES